MRSRSSPTSPSATPGSTRFIEDPAVADGVSDVVARTPAGLAFIEELAAEHLTLKAATPAEIVASQAETYRKKRLVLQGRRRLRALAGRPVPEYPGLALEPHLRHIVAGLGDLAEEKFFRAVAALRYP